MRIKPNTPTKLNQAGVTIVELMVSIGIAGVLASVVLAVSLGFFADTMRSQVTAQMAVDSHFTLRALVEDLRLAEGIGNTNTLTDANQPVGGWSTSDANNVLIINRPATTSSNDLIYDASTGDPYGNEYIYFVSNNVLYKRLLKNSAAPGNSINTTCPESLMSSTCPADRKYASYINDISFVFYDQTNTITPDPTLAHSAKVSLSMSRVVFGKTLTFNNSVLTKFRN